MYNLIILCMCSPVDHTHSLNQHTVAYYAKTYKQVRSVLDVEIGCWSFHNPHIPEQPQASEVNVVPRGLLYNIHSNL